MERRATRGSTAHHRRMRTAPAPALEEQKQERSGGLNCQRTPPAPGCFTIQLVIVFLWAAASLAILPLVLPPLPPPPLSLLLVPVCLLAVLAALAFVPLDAHSNVVGSSCL
ncbi:ARGOS-like protein [Lolium rigidum]|uniref:ARGOS-like protein n=1 Tax=Lolium rigidum TaxID=89674 RepID=UPI001F5D5690|nr:ARGOS-like protein [Lolium rigidum]